MTKLTLEKNTVLISSLLILVLLQGCKISREEKIPDLVNPDTVSPAITAEPSRHRFQLRFLPQLLLRFRLHILSRLFLLQEKRETA